MRSLALVAVTLACSGACLAGPDAGGHVRAQWHQPQANVRGPLAQAAALQPGIAALPAGGATLQTELRASGHGLSGTVTLQQQRLEGSPSQSSAWVNELYVAGGGPSWQFSAGKKIVGWDVGYGFRPNDVVQQEERRTLLATTAQGRPLLMAEHFDASTAWSFVWVNPTKPREQRGAEEPALAARVYRRDGALDWYGFARAGAHTAASAGAALAWVAGDAIELHASLRHARKADGKAIDASLVEPLRSNPWQSVSVRNVTQALVGGTWTNADQVSLLAEAWWDGAATPDAQWDAWNQRNRQLAALAGPGASSALIGALAGNLAWQTEAFSASTNLRRANLFARLSWQHDKWQPALDILYHPADAGRIVTAALGWQGDRWRFDGGVRGYGGPGDAVLAQLPSRRIAFCAATWAF